VTKGKKWMAGYPIRTAGPAGTCTHDEDLGVGTGASRKHIGAFCWFGKMEGEWGLGGRGYAWIGKGFLLYGQVGQLFITTKTSPGETKSWRLVRAGRSSRSVAFSPRATFFVPPQRTCPPCRQKKERQQALFMSGLSGGVCHPCFRPVL